MLIVSYTNKMAYGEPGPNLVIRGTCEAMGGLISKINKLCESGTSFDLIPMKGVKLVGIGKLHFQSSENGKILSKLNEGENSVEMNLDPSIWKKGLDKIQGLQEKHCFQYFEFDDVEDLVEEANIILESIDIKELLERGI